MIAIDLPWPANELRPNARPHWAAKARATKKARIAAAWACKIAGIRPNDPDIPQALRVTAVFAPPTAHARDDDNMLSACKAYFDGVADFIGVDDSKWSIAIRREAAVKGGLVRIELEAQ